MMPLDGHQRARACTPLGATRLAANPDSVWGDLCRWLSSGSIVACQHKHKGVDATREVAGSWGLMANHVYSVIDAHQVKPEFLFSCFLFLVSCFLLFTVYSLCVYKPWGYTLQAVGSASLRVRVPTGGAPPTPPTPLTNRACAGCGRAATPPPHPH